MTVQDPHAPVPQPILHPFNCTVKQKKEKKRYILVAFASKCIMHFLVKINSGKYKHKAVSRSLLFKNVVIFALQIEYLEI